MSLAPSILSQISDDLSRLASGARGFVASVRTDHGHVFSGIVWKANAVVVSEQILPESAEYDVTIGDQTVKANLAGRDDGTNVAVLKLEADVPHQLPEFSEAKVGSLALVLGAASAGISARLAIVRSVSGAWESLAGATIDQRIVLDTRLGGDEGGPVLSAEGRIIGMSTRGARRDSIVIPASTVDKSVAVLLAKGSIERGWLGVALRPVALPETLRPHNHQRAGLMVMEVSADTPAGRAGIVAGDIILSAGGLPANRFGNITRQLGPGSIGKSVEIQLARAGNIVTAEVTIEPRRR